MFSTRFVILARIYGKKSIPPNFRPKNFFFRKKSLLFAAKTQSLPRTLSPAALHE